MARATPTAASLVELFSSLLGVPTTVAKAAAGPPPKGACLATYVCAQGAAQAMAICDLEFAAATATSLSMLPPAVAADAVRAGRLSDVLGENAYEVFNVIAQLFNVDADKHVRVGSLYLAPKPPPAEVLGRLRGVKLRADYGVTVRGYAPGRLTFLVETA